MIPPHQPSPFSLTLLVIATVLVLIVVSVAFAVDSLGASLIGTLLLAGSIWFTASMLREALAVDDADQV